MFFRKYGFPEESELVVCTVTKILPHSVFVNIDEYDRSGMIHISEVSPGSIRNIRDFVKEGKVVVCKVLQVNKEKGHIDLSLRRVTESQKRGKINEMKLEQKAEKIVELIAHKNKKDFKGFYSEIIQSIFKKYSSLNACFEEVANAKVSLESLGVQKEIAEQLAEIIKQRIKPLEIEIRGIFTISTYASNGVEIIREALLNAEKIGKGSASINYMGAGKYKMTIKSDNYKSAEKILKEIIDKMEKFFSRENTLFDFARE